MVVSMDYMVSNMVIYMEGFYGFYGWFLWLIYGLYGCFHGWLLGVVFWCSCVNVFSLMLAVSMVSRDGFYGF